jgi:pre-mRNA-splicing helicase BRR2
VKTRGLLEILSNSTEFGRMVVRHHEGRMLESLAKHVPVAMPATMKRFSDVAIKANVLLQCHFSRRPLTSELKCVRIYVLEGLRTASRVCGGFHGCVVCGC